MSAQKVNVKKLAAMFCVALIGGVEAAENDNVIAGLSWNDSAKRVETALNDLCHSVDVINATPVQFPLAATTEQHIRCENLTLPSGAVDVAVFVVADDALKMIELHGGAVSALVEADREPLGHYLKYDVYDNGEMFADPVDDAVWLMSAEALHPNLFTWSDPYLAGADALAPVYDASAALPALLALGGDIEILKPQFAAACPQMNVEEIKEPWLESGPEAQTQINCFGFEYAGFPRKFEAVFGDGKLELVWILTGKGEEARVRDSLVKEFGAPEHVGKKWEVFSGGQVSLRKDKPEILVISEKLIPYYQADFGSE